MSSQALTKEEQFRAHEDAQRPVENLPAASPMQLLDRALAMGATPETLKQLMDLQDRHEGKEARRAFDAAVADAKAEIKPISKNREGHNNKRYADFAALASAVDPIISKHGLSYRFRTHQEDGRIKVTCVLSHRAGHSEETTLEGPADTSGSKNAIQAIGSTLTYLQRYSLTQALGLAASDDDNGEAAGGNDVLSDEQRQELIDLADEVEADKEAFCRYFKIGSFADIRVKDFDRAKAALEKKRKAA